MTMVGDEYVLAMMLPHGRPWSEKEKKARRSACVHGDGAATAAAQRQQQQRRRQEREQQEQQRLQHQRREPNQQHQFALVGKARAPSASRRQPSSQQAWMPWSDFEYSRAISNLFLRSKGLGASGRDTPRRVWAESRGERVTWME